MRYFLFSTAVAALLSSPAAAQPGSSTAPAMVEEVIVTSRQREERVQDVPAAVSGISAQQLSDLGGLKDIKDLSYLLPGLAFVDTGNINAENNIRGAGAGTARTAGVDSPIAVLRDGASITGGVIGGRTFTRGDLFDLARVEVTRGPQGALYGVNAVGGVIQAISQRPKADYGFMASTVWSPDIERYQVDAIANLPISPAFGLRLGVQYAHKNDGFFYNAFTQSHADVEDYRGFKAAAEWRPTDDLSVFVVLDQNDEISPSNRIKSVNQRNDPTAAATQVGPPDIDGPFIIQQNTSNVANRNVANFNTQVEWTSPIGEFTSITLLRRRDATFSQDEDGSAPGYASPPFPAATCGTRLCSTTFQDETEIASQELRLAGDFGDALTWIVGGNVQGKQSDFSTISDNRTTSATNLAPSPTANATSVAKEEELQFGLFGSASWQVTERLTVDGAIRWNRSEKKYDAYSIVRQPSPTLSCVDVYRQPLSVFATNPTCARSRALLEDTFTTTAPSASARYEIAPNWRVFGSAAIGYRAGGFNGNSVLDPAIPQSFQPEKNIAVEVGTKFEVAGAFFTFAAFHNDFDDLLVTVDSIGPDSVSRNYRFNAGKAETYGVDAEVFGRIKAPGIGGVVNYTAAINYLTGEIDSGPYKGQTVEGSPEWTYTFTASYRRPLGKDWDLVASTSYRRQRGGYTSTARINNQVELSNIDLWNASLGVDNGRWRATVEARNLFDETYETLRDATRSVYGDPREIRFTLTHAFGSEAR